MNHEATSVGFIISWISTWRSKSQPLHTRRQKVLQLHSSKPRSFQDYSQTTCNITPDHKKGLFVIFHRQSHLHLVEGRQCGMASIDWRRPSLAHRLVTRIAICKDQPRIEVADANMEQNGTYHRRSLPLLSTHESFWLTRSSNAPLPTWWQQKQGMQSITKYTEHFHVITFLKSNNVLTLCVIRYGLGAYLKSSPFEWCKQR